MDGFYQDRGPTQDTQIIKMRKKGTVDPNQVLAYVFKALVEKGYDPVIQIEGYLMSGDPTYITNHKNARSMISYVEIDELIEELIRSYVEANHLADSSF